MIDNHQTPMCVCPCSTYTNVSVKAYCEAIYSYALIVNVLIRSPASKFRLYLSADM